MKTTKALLVAAVALAAVTAYTSSAQAQQDVTVNSTVTVQNALELTVAEHLNFGTVVAAGGAGVTSTLAVHPLTNLLTPTNNTPSLFAVIDSADAQAAHITVENAAPGAVLTIEIDTPTPLSYTDPLTSVVTSFNLTGFSTSWNGAPPVTRTPLASWTQTVDALLAVNQLNIGATLSTIAGTTYPIGTDPAVPQVYTGTFDVSFQY